MKDDGSSVLEDLKLTKSYYLEAQTCGSYFWLSHRDVFGKCSIVNRSTCPTNCSTIDRVRSLIVVFVVRCLLIIVLVRTSSCVFGANPSS